MDLKHNKSVEKAVDEAFAKMLSTLTSIADESSEILANPKHAALLEGAGCEVRLLEQLNED
jgi:hypothetical protein